MPWGGALNLADGHDLLPRGTIGVSAARELVALRSVDCLYERDGGLAVDSLRRPVGLSLGYAPVPATLPSAEVVETHEEEVVWGGDLFNQFGHFLVESVARLWPSIAGGELEGLPVVFRAPREAPFVREWLEGFGVQTIYLPENGAARFARMFVPEQSWRLGAWIAPEMRDAHLHARRGIEVPSAPRRDVLWLSRSGLSRDRVAYDEGLLEWILGDRVTPVQLETMTLAEQIATLESCRAVAGVMGSAFHAILPAKSTPDCLYLCPSFAKGPYTAQHQILGGKATFVESVPPAARVRRLRRDGFLFPGGHRVLIPETLEALRATLLPGLLEERRLAAFAGPAQGRHRGSPGEIETAAIEVIRDPHSAAARTRLGAMFEERGLAGLAAEQRRTVADLTDDGPV